MHDELTRRGGAEILLEEIIRIFPQADVYALYAGKPRIKVGETVYQVKTSYLQNLPGWFRRHPSRVLPFLASAAESFDLSRYDLVLSSSSGLSKGVVTRVDVPHVCYCHTPTRYLWDNTHEALNRARYGSKWLLRLILHFLRMSDFSAAQRVDLFIANSEYTQNRISRYYRQRSQVVYPPIDTVFWHPGAGVKEDFFLLAGRLTPAKYFDRAVRVCTKLDLPLVIVGEGSQKRKLMQMAGRKVSFMSHLSREELRQVYRSCRALLQPGVEDFGMAAAEALGCGTPVIALSEGGVLEMVDDGRSGVLYEGNHEEALAEAIRRFISIENELSREAMQRTVFKFSKQRFKEGILRHVQEVMGRGENKR